MIVSTSKTCYGNEKNECVSRAQNSERHSVKTVCLQKIVKTQEVTEGLGKNKIKYSFILILEKYSS